MEKSILALQMKSKFQDREANFFHVETLLDDFFKKNDVKADIFILPELWQINWCSAVLDKFSEDENGESVNFLKKIAKKYGFCVLGGSYVRKNDGKFYNSCPVISASGELVAHYDKNFPFSIDNEDKFISAGKNLLTLDLDGFKIGLSICYDIRFPEIYRNYMKDEAPHLLVDMAIWPDERQKAYEYLVHSRAIENQAYFLGLSLCGEIIDGYRACGNSLLVDFEGNTVSQLDEGENFIYAQIDTNKQEKMREALFHLKNIREFNFKNEVVKI